MLKAIMKFFKSLNNNSHPGEIAHAVCLGMVLGLTPKDNAFWYVLFVFFLFIRINKSALFIFTFIFALIAPAFDNIFHQVGYSILTYEKLTPVFAKLIDIPFVFFTKFNNTIVMGSFVTAVAAYIPMYFLVRIFVRYWRAIFSPLVRKTRLVNFLSKIPLVQKIQEIGDDLA
ncbi:MAG: TIGR03546 family protein [Treponema sp.]|nr:TIGR03546 family protein [Treponema sp.]